MDGAAQAELWDDYRIVGRLFGLRAADMPETLSDFERYGREMLAGDELHVTDWARTRAREIVLEPPVPARAAAGGRGGQLHHDRAAAGADPA